MKMTIPKSVELVDNELYFLDQTKLPTKIEVEKQNTIEDVWHSIKQLKVRGAPAIGIAGGYGLALSMKDFKNSSTQEFLTLLEKNGNYLDSARPTAVNLRWAIDRIINRAKNSGCSTTKELYGVVLKEAIGIHEEDKLICKQIGGHGQSLIKDGVGVLTHCNAGALAVSEFGTALAPMYVAHKKGIRFRVYADETRPLLQGARLTSFELHHAGIDVTLITDNMAAHIMSQGLIDVIIVGTDRVAANGDIANKIGTLGVAILAKYFNIPLYIACPSSTIDLATKTGKDIVIEERDGSEVYKFAGVLTAPESIKTRNPAFDVTPAELITGIITEKGILKPPFSEALKLF